MKHLTKLKLIKENLKQETQLNLAHLIDDGFFVDVIENISDNSSNLTRIWLPINSSDTDYSYENSQDFNWIDIEDEIVRCLKLTSENYDIEYLYTIASKDQDGFGFKRMEWNINLLLQKLTFGYANPGKIKSIVWYCSPKNI